MKNDTNPPTRSRRGGKGADPPDAPHPPPAPGGFVAKARDLQSLRDAVVDAAGVGTGLWLSYLFVLLYFAVTVGGITHGDLLFERPVKLPFLNVDLPPVGFFILGPALLLIVHAYVLIHFTMLAGKVGVFHSELQSQIGDEDARTRLRRQLPSNVFVQLLAGPREVRSGPVGFMLQLVAQISLVVSPLAVLVLFQLQFLPYHHQAITMWQRATVLGDIALIWALWPSVAAGRATRIRWRDLRRPKIAAAAVASLAPILLVWTIATFPGEWLHEKLPSFRFIPTGTLARNAYHGPHGVTNSFQRTSLHQLLMAGAADEISRKPTSLWSNRLVLPYLDPIDRAKFDTDAKVEIASQAISFRGRHLEGAILTFARLQKLDFTAAHLQGAIFENSDLQGAKLERADLRDASFRGADLRSASLWDADLRGATFHSAVLADQNFYGARLDGADFDLAYANGASFQHAHLTAASFHAAYLIGAQFNDARLDGAWFNRARLMAATIAMRYGSLLGASFDDAWLQGATLQMGHLEGATFENVFLWRATLQRNKHIPPPRDFNWTHDLAPARIVLPRFDPAFGDCARPFCEWSEEYFNAWKQFIESWTPKNSQKGTLERIAVLDPTKPPPDIEESWTALARRSPDRDAYEKSLAAIFRKIGCEEDGAPYVIRGLLRNLKTRFAPDSKHPAAVASAFLDANCLGARRLSDDDKGQLREIADPAPPFMPTIKPPAPPIMPTINPPARPDTRL